MNLPAPLFIVLGYLLPIVVLIVITRIRVRRRRAALALQGESQPKFIEPADEPQPGFFLSRFTLPQRTYLRRQRGWAFYGYAICAWILFVILSANLLPEQVHRYVSSQSLPQQVWDSYLGGFGLSGSTVVCILAFMTAIISITDLRVPSGAVFMRTRPLSLRFLFWARVGLALATLLAAILTALLGSLLLLLIFYGPVWNHLQVVAVTPDAMHRVVTLGTAHQHRTTPGDASLLHSWLSLLMMTAFIFSLIVATASLPLDFFGKPKSRLIPGLAGGLVGSQLLPFSRFVLSSRVAKVLLPHSGTGSPFPLQAWLVPLLLIAVLLWSAQSFSARAET
jgi:hypothetical protein